MQIADDPETLRIKQNTKNISNVAYHGDIQKKANMEKQRELTEIVDNRGKKCRNAVFLMFTHLQLPFLQKKSLTILLMAKQIERAIFSVMNCSLK